MGGKAKEDFVPANIYVRMVVFGLGEGTDLVHEGQGLGEALEFELAAEFTLLDLPSGEFGNLLGDFVGCEQGWHRLV